MIAARWIFVALIAVALAAHAQPVDVPLLTGRIVDNAEILKPETRRRLSDEMQAHEQRTTNQIAVVTVPTLNGESVETYAARVFEQWKLGRKDKDNGVLVLVVPQDRRMRIEVGYGLEGTLTDADTARIIRDVMTPAFRAGDYDGGISRGVAAVIAQLEGKAAAPGAPTVKGTRSRAPEIWAIPIDLYIMIVFCVFFYGIVGVFTALGILTPGLGWFFYFFLIPFWAMSSLLVFGPGIALYIVITYLVGFPVIKLLVARTAFYRKAVEEQEIKGRYSIGGFIQLGNGGGWTSSGVSDSGGGGASGNGGFSGGGGSSGGGGASGSW